MMIAYHIIKDEKFRNEANQILGKDANKTFLDLCQKYDNEKLIDLFEDCKKITYWPKIVITILDGSSLENSNLSDLRIQNISEIETCFSESIIASKRRLSE